MTFIKKFESIKKKFANPDLSEITEDFAVQINLTDEDCGGSFYAAFKDGQFSVEPYDYNDRSAMVTTDSKTFEEFLNGKKFIYDMAIQGNERHINFLASAAKKSPAPKKSAAGKSAVKKTTAKKTTSKK